MLIGVISDTHIPERASKIPENVFEIFDGVDMILHAGDLVSLEIRDILNTLAPTTCVQGNMDRYYGIKLPEREWVEVGGVKIGLNHGEVYPRGNTQQLRYIGLEMGVDVLITGHTHYAFINQMMGLLLLNPGSPTVPRLSDPSVMLLEVDDGEVEAELIKIGDSTCKALNYQGRGIQ
ncbi:MAG: metallophosphoesterase [Euryarchaeota archaeon]|jgi:putative phosphoesterase|nr:metallophosphoesterase [Euryarchaeota archaeon]